MAHKIIGKKCTISLNTRAEDTWLDCHLDGLDALGATFSFTSRGSENVLFAPLASIAYVATKSSGEDEDEVEAKE